MKLLRENLVVRFSIASFLVMGTVAIVLAVVLSNKIRSDAVDDLVAEAVGASSGKLLRTLKPEDLLTPMTGERYDRFHNFVQESIVSDRTARIKLWGADGTVIYSNDPTQVGDQFPTKQNLLTALRGEFAVEIKVAEDPENELERHLGTLMEVYTPIIFPGTSIPQGSLEIYQYYGPTASRISTMHRWLFGGLGIGLGTLYVGLVFIVWGGWRTINSQDRQLKSSLQEKEVLLREIHHRVKNNLQVVSSLLNVKSKHIKDPQALESLRESRSRVQSMALVHQKLYDSRDLAGVDFADYSLSLVSALMSSYKDNSKNIALNINGDETRLDMNSAVPCGLIINELVSNSLKHAFSVQKEGEIKIDLRSTTDSGVSLTVGDNGKGFPDDLDFRNADSLGLQLVNTLTKQLKGTIELDRSEGTAFTLSFPGLTGKVVG